METIALIQATAFKLNNIRGMNSLQAYNHTVKTLDRYREQLGVAAVNTSNARWDIWGSIFYTLCVYTTIGKVFFAMFYVTVTKSHYHSRS